MNVILIRYGEIHLKGANRFVFERALCDNIQKALVNIPNELKKISGRFVLYNYPQKNEGEIIERLQKVFGIHSFSVAIKLENTPEAIRNECAKLKISGSFRVTVRRASKIFPIKSTEFSADLGEIILNTNPDATVDLHNPATEVKVDIREDGYTYLSTHTYMGADGMPVGTAGKGLLLLSGGIDSPVAGYFMAKRGLHVDALHFHSFPYTGELAKNKVIKLANELSAYAGSLNLHVVSFTKIQEEIHKNCDSRFMITIMRRIMMRIACRIAKNSHAGAIVTGESLGQVASQTLQSITVTNAVVDIPVFRPLIGFDKLDIIGIAKKIGTYETSILPYEDCCTVFLPKNPATQPKLDEVEKQEAKLDIETLINEALDTEEIIPIPNLD